MHMKSVGYSGGKEPVTVSLLAVMYDPATSVGQKQGSVRAHLLSVSVSVCAYLCIYACTCVYAHMYTGVPCLSKVQLTLLRFYERLTRVPVFATQKKSVEDFCSYEKKVKKQN